MDNQDSIQRQLPTKGDHEAHSSYNKHFLNMYAVLTIDDVVEILKLHGVVASQISKQELFNRLIYLHRHHSDLIEDRKTLDDRRQQNITSGHHQKDTKMGTYQVQSHPHDNVHLHLPRLTTSARCNQDEGSPRLLKASRKEREDQDEMTSEWREEGINESRSPRCIPSRMVPDHTLLHLRKQHADVLDALISELHVNALPPTSLEEASQISSSPQCALPYPNLVPNEALNVPGVEDEDRKDNVGENENVEAAMIAEENEEEDEGNFEAKAVRKK